MNSRKSLAMLSFNIYCVLVLYEGEVFFFLSLVAGTFSFILKYVRVKASAQRRYQ
jgi:hypothetical protein